MKRADVLRSDGAVIGCYSVHLYCSLVNHSVYDVRWSIFDPGEFTGESEAQCLTEARKDGWWISRTDADGKRAVLCPFHAREVPR